MSELFRHMLIYDGNQGWVTLVFHEDGSVTWEWDWPGKETTSPEDTEE